MVNDIGLSAIWHTRMRLALATLLGEKDLDPYRTADFKGTLGACSARIFQHQM